MPAALALKKIPQPTVLYFFLFFNFSNLTAPQFLWPRGIEKCPLVPHYRISADTVGHSGIRFHEYCIQASYRLIQFFAYNSI